MKRTEVVMPKWGEMTEGEIARWLKKEGEYVQEGEELVEIFTEKLNTTMEAPERGILAKILVAENTPVPVGTPIAIIEEAQ